MTLLSEGCERVFPGIRKEDAGVVLQMSRRSICRQVSSRTTAAAKGLKGGSASLFPGTDDAEKEIVL